MNSHHILKPENCCLLVIDPQERLMQVIHDADRVERNTVLMIHCARILGIPVLATTQYLKGLGPLVAPIAGLVPQEQWIDKISFSTMAYGQVDAWLSALPARLDTVLVTGVESHICVHQSTMGLCAQGFRPWIVADAVSSRKKENHDLALARFRDMGVVVGSAEMAVYELLGRADSPEFKAMRPYLL